MTPSLSGRLQTRLLLALVVGLPVVLLISLLSGAVTAPAALLVLSVGTALGLGWETVYQLIQQRRWDGDWPGLVALGAGAVEALIAYPVIHLLGGTLGVGSYALLVGITWLALWLAPRGPLSVFLPHWRHQGARVVPERRTPRPQPERQGLSLPQLALPTAWRVRPSRQQLVVLGGLAAMVVGVLLLAPLVGPRDHHEPASAMAHPAVEGPKASTHVRTTTWNTRHRVRPESLRFPAVGVHDELSQVRLTSSGTLGAPRGGHAAWFAQGAAPGQRGPAVLVGDSTGVFAHLDRARIGQRFTTVRSDGSVVRFVVDDVVSVDAAAFPTQRVYGHSLKPLARLISYDTRTGRNVIVLAHAVAVEALTTRS